MYLSLVSYFLFENLFLRSVSQPNFCNQDTYIFILIYFNLFFITTFNRTLRQLCDLCHDCILLRELYWNN